MKKNPESPEEIFQDYVADWQTAFGQELESIILYGSAARGEYAPGKSDINFLVVLSLQGITALRPAIELAEKWRKGGVAVPLVMTRAYLDNSLDSFPMEFLSMQKHYKLVFGQDLLRDLKISMNHLRMQLEREVKGKLLHLRESFLAEGVDRDRLLELLRQTLPAFESLFEALLYLREQPIPPHRREVFMQAVKLAALDQNFFDKLFAVVQQETKPYRNELLDLFEKYISQIRQLALFIDAMDKTQ